MTSVPKLLIILEDFPADRIAQDSNPILSLKRKKTEEKAKVVAPVWEEEFIQFLAAIAVLPRTILNNRMNCTIMI